MNIKADFKGGYAMRAKMNLKQVLAILLLSAMVFSAAACRNGNEEGKESTGSESVNTSGTTAPGEEEPKYHWTLGEHDFGGYKFRMAGVDPALWSDYDMQIDADVSSTAVIDVGIYKRNMAVEDQLDIDIVQIKLSDYLFDLPEYLSSYVQSGDDKFDTLLMVDRNAITSAISGNLIAYSDLPGMELTGDYWSTVNKDISISGKYFFAYGDDSIHFLQSANSLLFNKALKEDLNIEEDFYDMVRNDSWTVDNFFKIAKRGFGDLDGNGLYEDTDRWGIIADADMYFPSFWTSAGIQTVEKDENDIPYFSIPDNELFYTVSEKIVSESFKDGMIYQTLYDNPTVYTIERYGLIGSGDMMFVDGKGLFRTATFHTLSNLRQMKDDFGILPYPKWSENDSEYISRVYSGFPTVVPKTSKRPEVVGIVLEALAYRAKTEFIDDYYDLLLKGRETRDDESKEMIDIILNNRRMDLGDTFWYDTIRLQYQNKLAAGEGDLVSLTGSISKLVEQTIQITVKKIGEQKS